jgi:neutral ceramidase
MSLQVGVAVRSVEVPPGTPMAGFAARHSPSTGTHDPTTVRALVLDDVALVTVDVCVLHEGTCEAIERAAAVPTVIVTATHTHGGPSVGGGRAGQHSPGVHDAIVRAAVDAVEEASARQRAARMYWASCTGLDVARDRRRPDRRIDPPLTALRFSDASDGAVIATLVSYPCHPVVLDASNTLITSDYVHPLREAVERHSGQPCIFLTGTAGDVNTGHAAIASFDSTPAAARTFAQAERIGNRLADGLAAAAWSEVASDVAIVRTRSVSLGYEPLTREGVDARRREWESLLGRAGPGQAVVLRCWIDWAAGWTPECLSTPWQGRVAAIDLGDAVIVTLPGEPFLWAGEALAAQGRHVLVAGYADGVAGYLPTTEAYAEGGYEVDDACMYYSMPGPFRRGSLESVVEVALQLMGAE